VWGRCGRGSIVDRVALPIGVSQCYLRGRPMRETSQFCVAAASYKCTVPAATSKEIRIDRLRNGSKQIHPVTIRLWRQRRLYLEDTSYKDLKSRYTLPVYTGRMYGPYIRAVYTARIYGWCVPGARIIRPVHTARTEKAWHAMLLSSTARIYG